MDNVLFAFLLTLFAGLSTGIGSTIALFAKNQYQVSIHQPWVFRRGYALCIYDRNFL